MKVPVRSFALICAFLLSMMSFPAVSASKVISLDHGEIETEALEKGEKAEVTIDVVSGECIDLYVLPDEEFLKDMTLSGNFTCVEELSVRNITSYNFKFEPEDDEVIYYIVMVCPENHSAIENETPQDTKVQVSVRYPDIEQRDLFFGYMATGFVVFIYAYIFLVIRHKKKKGEF